MYRSTNPRQRTLAALAAGTLVTGMALMLIVGLRVNLSGPRLMSLVAVSLVPPPPEPEPPPPPPARSTAPRGAQSPADLRNRASPVLAAPNPLPSTPVIAATQPAEGDAPQSGAADRAGPGEGAGGTGDGTGGGGGGIATGPVQVRGRLSVDDFPFGLIGPGERASVRLRYVVETDGRVSTCRILRSSGFAEVDAMACRLIEQRFRYRPARNAAGDPVRAGVEETHTWFRRATAQSEPSPQRDTVQLLRTN